jgi:glycosyltransferase involved in cell wall biosynthesis
MAPFLSICILTYNRAATLKETLDSFLPQVMAREDVELMVCDDASPDNTGEFMRVYCERYPRIRYIRHAENLGQDGNIIATIEAAAGEYAMLFSDDDLAPPDFVARLVEDLREVRPTVAYVNHSPFFDDDPAKLGPPTQPVLKRVFTNPTEFFLYTGLGFMSAVAVKTDEARKQTSKVSRGLSSAHVDISSRVALTAGPPCLFDGAITVWARYELNATYDVLTNGPMNVTRVHENLRDEGLLTQADVDWFNRKAIKLFLPRCIVNNRLNSITRKPVPASDLWKLYGRYPQFYFPSFFLAILPQPLMRAIFGPLRERMRRKRRRMLDEGGPMPDPGHIAP